MFLIATVVAIHLGAKRPFLKVQYTGGSETLNRNPSQSLHAGFNHNYGIIIMLIIIKVIIITNCRSNDKTLPEDGSRFNF